MPLANRSLHTYFAAQADQAWHELQNSGVQTRASLQSAWQKLLLASEYVMTQCHRYAGLSAWLEEHAADDALDEIQLRQELTNLLAPAECADDMLAPLREFRHRYIGWLIWQDIVAQASVDSLLEQLSLLADIIIDVTENKLFSLHSAKYGVPRNAHGEPQHLLVFAMGKLGASELNLSSDIDLIFAYQADGELDTLSYQQFYTRLSQDLIKVLDQRTADGFVYRVDMRLRPWGNAGALVTSLSSLASYYAKQGREWERYALIKMRPIGGDIEVGNEFVEQLKPFVYRRYLDYGALDSLRKMKRLIEREVRQQGRYDDIKLGAGGIREIEFIVQVYQLVHGGQQVSLQQPNLLTVLPELGRLGLMPSRLMDELSSAYRFLRRTEHHLQAWQDQQTQQLPDHQEAQARLAYSLGFTQLSAYQNQLTYHRERVHYQFQQLISLPEDESSIADSVDQQSIALWRGQLTKIRAEQLLASFGIQQVGQLHEALTEFRQRLPSHWQQYGDSLDRILPRLLEALGYHHGNASTLQPLLHLLEVLLDRNQHHLELLAENPRVINQLVKLFSLSEAIASLITTHTALLEELLDAAVLYSLPNREQLQDELRQQLLRVPEENIERQIDVLLHFKQVHKLRAMVQDASEQEPLMKVSGYLSDVASVVVQQALQMSQAIIIARYGVPRTSAGQPQDVDCGVVAYGKLGGQELGHDSDLDLVFLYQAAADGTTDGDKTLSNHQFYLRVTQQLVQILTTHTLAGRLFDVDMRLRPLGEAGTLAVSMAVFEKYQLEDAWTWEHQALVRADVITLSASLRQRFFEIRDKILRQRRDTQQLKVDVANMRNKLHQHQLTEFNPDEPSTLKFALGGIVDVEFMVQYGVLQWAYQHEALIQFTDNLRLLDVLATLEQVPAYEAGLLREAYLAYRSAVHRAALGNVLTTLEHRYIQELTQDVAALWQQWFLNHPAA